LKKYSSILACMAAAIVPSKSGYTEELVHEDWEGGWNDWGHEYRGASIVEESGAPSPSHALMFTFQNGMSAGDAPDMIRQPRF